LVGCVAFGPVTAQYIMVGAQDRKPAYLIAGWKKKDLFEDTTPVTQDIPLAPPLKGSTTPSRAKPGTVFTHGTLGDTADPNYNN
jgi:hypothetical protein